MQKKSPILSIHQASLFVQGQIILWHENWIEKKTRVELLLNAFWELSLLAYVIYAETSPVQFANQVKLG